MREQQLQELLARESELSSGQREELLRQLASWPAHTGAVVSGGGALHCDMISSIMMSITLHFKTFETFRSLLVHLIKFDFSGPFHIGMKELRVIWKSINACCVAVL